MLWEEFRQGMDILRKKTTSTALRGIHDENEVLPLNRLSSPGDPHAAMGRLIDFRNNRHFSVKPATRMRDEN
jgi:hypothetical protein